MAAVPGEVSDLSQIETTSTTYESDGAPIETYLARPRDGGSGAGIIVIHEAFGPVEHIHDVARRFANIGLHGGRAESLQPGGGARSGRHAGRLHEDVRPPRTPRQCVTWKARPRCCGPSRAATARWA